MLINTQEYWSVEINPKANWIVNFGKNHQELVLVFETEMRRISITYVYSCYIDN